MHKMTHHSTLPAQVVNACRHTPLPLPRPPPLIATVVQESQDIDTGVSGGSTDQGHMPLSQSQCRPQLERGRRRLAAGKEVSAGDVQAAVEGISGAGQQQEEGEQTPLYLSNLSHTEDARRVRQRVHRGGTGLEFAQGVAVEDVAGAAQQWALQHQHQGEEHGLGIDTGHSSHQTVQQHDGESPAKGGLQPCHMLFWLLRKGVSEQMNLELPESARCWQPSNHDEEDIR